MTGYVGPGVTSNYPQNEQLEPQCREGFGLDEILICSVPTRWAASPVITGVK